ncbi:MAG: 5'/3'-nucleotidase SurE [Salibacteraceae bacterium]
MSNNRPLILVCNDDGYSAPGINCLVEAMKPLGEVVVVAPDKPQSGMGHAITINATLRLQEHKREDGIKVFACSGTPVDCIKMAVKVVVDRRPALIVSGINHGANHSINVIYSGTMSAAIEGAMEGIPSIGFSLLDYSIDADFTAAGEIARKVAAQVLENGLAPNTCLNVNVPKLPLDQIRGIRICRQAKAYWREDFEERVNPYGKKYYWLAGDFENRDEGTDTDVWALENQYVSVVPTQYDLTHHSGLEALKTWEF